MVKDSCAQHKPGWEESGGKEEILHTTQVLLPWEGSHSFKLGIFFAVEAEGLVGIEKPLWT